MGLNVSGSMRRGPAFLPMRGMFAAWRAGGPSENDRKLAALHEVLPSGNAPRRNGTLGPFIYKGPCPCPVFEAGSFLFVPFVSRLSRFGGGMFAGLHVTKNFNDLHTRNKHAEPADSGPASCPVHVPNSGDRFPGRLNGTSAFCPVCDGGRHTVLFTSSHPAAAQEHAPHPDIFRCPCCCRSADRRNRGALP